MSTTGPQPTIAPPPAARTVDPAPIRKQFRLRATPERAFAAFTARMGAWWHKDHSLCKGTAQTDVIVESRAGGRWYETGADGSRHDWGRVLAWEPPHRLALAWQLTADWCYDPDFETTIEVTFAADGDGTIVTFEHRDLARFGDAAAAQRAEMDGGWGMLLERYAVAAG